jgi:crotonobetainyl-CoA:carnitine CoA-transferase CaiB-like acyl-CoA transferase
VLDVMQMHRHPQTLARDMVPAVDHPKAGRMQTIGLPVKFSATPGGVRHAAPLFGEHTRSILAAHGYSPAEIDRLVACGAVKAA